MKPLHPCQFTEEVEPLGLNMIMFWTAKQAEFVNKKLSTGSHTILIKKIMTPNIPEETELDNAYQKILIAGLENKVNQNDKKKKPCPNKRMVHIE